MDWSGTIVASYSFNLLLVYCFRDGYRITQRCLYAEPFYVVRTRRLDTDTNAEISARCGNPRDRLWVSGFSLSLSLSDIIKKLTLRNGRFHRLVYLSCAGQGPASLHRRSTFISRPFCLDAGQCRGVRERTAAGVQETWDTNAQRSKKKRAVLRRPRRKRGRAIKVHTKCNGRG